MKARAAAQAPALASAFAAGVPPIVVAMPLTGWRWAMRVAGV